MYDLVKEIVRWGTVMAIVALLAGCGTVKGLSGDLSWGFNKIDEAIVVPD